MSNQTNNELPTREALEAALDLAKEKHGYMSNQYQDILFDIAMLCWD